MPLDTPRHAVRILHGDLHLHRRPCLLRFHCLHEAILTCTASRRRFLHLRSSLYIVDSDDNASGLHFRASLPSQGHTNRKTLALLPLWTRVSNSCDPADQPRARRRTAPRPRSHSRTRTRTPTRPTPACVCTTGPHAALVCPASSSFSFPVSIPFNKRFGFAKAGMER